MMNLEFFVEEQSAEVALINLIPAILPDNVDYDFDIYTFQGKKDLLKKLPNRLKAYKHWITENQRIIVLIDRDSDDCVELKGQLEDIVASADLQTRTASPDQFHVINRIAIEELEAWFFGDVNALRTAYPRVPETLASKSAYRDPDAIQGGTWERLGQVLNDYHLGGLEKIRAAKEISRHMNPDVNRSRSFQVFRDTLRDIFT